MREQQYTVQRAVQETVMQNQAYTAYQPVTSYHTQYVDQGQYVTALQPTAPVVRNRLWCVPGGYQTNPATGQSAYYRGGLRWVPTQGPTVLRPTTTYMPNIVAQQVATTSYQPVQMTQQVPVTVNRLVNDVVSQQVPVQVCRMETVEEVREVPVTVQKPVTERVTCQVPVQKVRYEEEEHVRQVPYTTQRIEYEEVVEQIPVKVCRYVSETKSVQVPKTVAKWVAYTSTRLVPRIVTMRVPIGTTTYYSAPIVTTPATRVEKKTTPSVIVEKKTEPTPAKEPIKATPAEEKKGEPKDSDPVPTPSLGAPANSVTPASTDRRA
jgi:hypothetical protein